MSTPGWYPDPGGEPGRFRFWDGTSWSADTSPDPATSDPNDPGSSRPITSGSPAGRSSSRRRWIAPLIIGLVVVVIAAIALPTLLLSRRTPAALPIPTSSTATDAPPTSAAPIEPSTIEPSPNDTESSATTPTPEPAPAPTASNTPATAECPIGDPGVRQSHPSDSRVHGGGLSFPEVTGFEAAEQTTAYGWAYDVDGQQRLVGANWSINYVVGALGTFDGFDTPEQSVASVLSCSLRSPFYTSIVSAQQLRSQRVTVQGLPAWELRTEVRVDSPESGLAGDILEIIVVDTGSPESLSMFWATAPIGDTEALTQLETTIGELEVD